MCWAFDVEGMKGIVYVNLPNLWSIFQMTKCVHCITVKIHENPDQNRSIGNIFIWFACEKYWAEIWKDKIQWNEAIWRRKKTRLPKNMFGRRKLFWFSFGINKRKLKNLTQCFMERKKATKFVFEMKIKSVNFLFFLSECVCVISQRRGIMNCEMVCGY